jgi:rhodanese-related sulfurtransferase
MTVQDTVEIIYGSDIETLKGLEANDVEVKGDVFLFDVRDSDSFNEAHVPGAINIPFGELEERMDEFREKAETRKLFAICKTSVTSKMAKELLAENGIEAFSIDAGTDGWIEEGLPVVRG